MPGENIIMSEEITGSLRIDNQGGTIWFVDSDGATRLRVTHLKRPIPYDVFIDLASVAALTSYTKDGHPV